VSPSFFRDTFPNTDPDAPSRIGAAGVFLTILLGAAVRVFASLHTYIINPDGIYYIHQAKAIYFGEWDVLTSCHLIFVSIYPFLISAGYVLFREWIMAAQFVSLLFGTATLIPLYLLCRRFLDRDTSILTLLLFAMLPVFVSGSVEIVRDPVCWFFLALGLYFFVSSYKESGRLSLALSCLCLMTASWARVESALFLMIGLVYLLAVPQRGRIAKATFFALPLMGAFLLVVVAGMLLDQPLTRILRLDDIVHKLSAPILSYQTLREGLSELTRQLHEGVIPYFLQWTRQVVWLVALGIVVKYMIRAYFYLFFVLFLLGLGAAWRRSREEPEILYLSISAAAIFAVYYLHVIQTWMMCDRYWGIFMLPAVIAVGFGLKKAVSLLTTRCRLRASTAFSILGFLILIFMLPKDLKPSEGDKAVYREIGERIAQKEGNAKEIRIVKSLKTPDWTPFYSNLNYAGAACPFTDFGIKETDFDGTVFKDYQGFMGYLRNNHSAYFLWEEGVWPKDAFHLLDRQRPEDLIEVGRWHQSDVGRIILFRVQPEGVPSLSGSNQDPVRSPSSGPDD